MVELQFTELAGGEHTGLPYWVNELLVEDGVRFAVCGKDLITVSRFNNIQLLKSAYQVGCEPGGAKFFTVLWLTASENFLTSQTFLFAKQRERRSALFGRWPNRMLP